MGKCKFVNKLTNGEGLLIFFLKQLFGAFAGFLIATTWGAGDRLYRAVSKAPECSVKFVSKDSIGYEYKWRISLKDRNAGSMLIYPKDDVLILLKTLERPNRVTSVIEVDPSQDTAHAKGVVLDYIDDGDNVNISFSTFSSKPLSIKNTKDAKCEDLLLSF